MNSSNNTDFRRHMIRYIREHFGELLGEHAALLDEEGGLDQLQAMIAEGTLERSL